MQIEKSTLTFLKDLKKNNNREWFTDHKDRFTKEQTKMKAFYTAIRNDLEKHDTIEKFKLFRIYRDVRFSKDKTPYKPHFAGSYSRLGKELRGGYYLRIRPGESFLAGGFWQPNKEDILRLRKEFEVDATEFREILNDKTFVKTFGVIQGEELKTAPRNFDKEHKNIDLIRKKAFIAVRNFTDEEILKPSFLKTINESFLALRPFFNYMSSVLTTDLNGESII